MQQLCFCKFLLNVGNTFDVGHPMGRTEVLNPDVLRMDMVCLAALKRTPRGRTLEPQWTYVWWPADVLCLLGCGRLPSSRTCRWAWCRAISSDFCQSCTTARYVREKRCRFYEKVSMAATRNQRHIQECHSHECHSQMACCNYVLWSQTLLPVRIFIRPITSCLNLYPCLPPILIVSFCLQLSDQHLFSCLFWKDKFQPFCKFVGVIYL